MNGVYDARHTVAAIDSERQDHRRDLRLGQDFGPAWPASCWRHPEGLARPGVQPARTCTAEGKSRAKAQGRAYEATAGASGAKERGHLAPREERYAARIGPEPRV
jgi:hypothetical protein